MFVKIMSPMTAENLAASVNAIVDLTGAPLDNKHMLTRSGGDDTEARLLAGKLATFRYRLLELVGGRKLSPGTNAAYLALQNAIDAGMEDVLIEIKTACEDYRAKVEAHQTGNPKIRRLGKACARGVDYEYYSLVGTILSCTNNALRTITGQIA